MRRVALSLREACSRFTGTELLLAFLIIFGPLTYGGVTLFSTAVIQTATILVAVWWLLAMTRQGSWRLVRTPVDLPLLALVIWASLSMLWSVYPYATRIELYKLYTYVAIFYMAVNAFQDPRRLLRMTRVIVIFGSIFATVGLLGAEQLLKQIPYYVPVVERNQSPGLRLTFVNHSNFAGYLEMVCLLCIGLALASRGAKRILLLCLASYIALSVLLSLSRGGTLGLLFGFLSLCVILLLDRRERKLLLWTGGLAAAVALGMVGLVRGELFLDRMETLKEPLAAGELRLEMWQESLEAIAARPLAGSGFGTYLHASPRYQSLRTARWVIDHPHNEYLERTAELGLVGGALALLGLIVFFGTSLRRIRAQRRLRLRRLALGALAACLALLVHDVVDFQFSIPSNAVLFVICCALVLAAIAPSVTSKADVSFNLRLTGPWRRVALGAIPVLGGYLVLLVVAPALGRHYLRQARELREVGEYEQASRKLRQALAVDPGNSRHHAALVDVMLQIAGAPKSKARDENAQLAKALEQFETALARCPVSVYYHNRRAQVLLRLGRQREAGEAFARAALLGPRRFYARYHLAQYMLRHGDREQAYEEVKEAIRLNERYLTPILHQIWQGVPDYHEVKKAVPQVASMRRVFAHFLLVKNQEEAGLRELARAFYLEPAPARALEHVRALRQVGDHRSAMQACQTYQKRFPDDQSLAKELVATVAGTDGALEAIDVIQDLLADNPAAPGLHAMLRGIYLDQGDPASADASFRRLLAVMPDDARVYLDYAAFLKAQRRSEEALDLLQVATERMPDYVILDYERAVLLRGLGSSAEAIAVLRQVVRREPQNSYYRYTLGTLYEEIGMYQAAVEEWQRILETAPEHAASRRALDHLYQRIGLDVGRGPELR